MRETIRDVFWDTASRFSDHIALVEEGRSYSYKEIAQQVAGVASRLVDAGVTTGTTVAVCAQPSTRGIVSMLGVLCAGGVYVPIDPETPASRNREVLSHSKASLVLGVEDLATPGAFQESSIAHAVNHSPPANNLPDVRIEPSHLACVFYTSGSSGRPKGVAIEHHSVVNYMRSIAPVYELSPRDKIMPFFSIAFDWSLEELLLPLSVGAVIVTPRDRRYQTPMELAIAIKEAAISVVGMPPSYLGQLTDFLRDNDPTLVSSLRLVVTGGEQLTPQVWSQWDSLQLGIPIINTYGPTEATVVTTHHRLLPGAKYDGEIPIGHSIDNTHVQILDESLAPVPHGEEGEIAIGGEGVARGYLGDEDATAERFVADPFTSMPGGRLYRTGDRGVIRPSDLSLLFRGRLDDQIKLHGYRVELGEIEATLCIHPLISEAVVILSTEEPRRLVAYLGTRGEDVPTSQLRQFLGSRLPHYMVPSYFVALDTLPRGINGKLDRTNLPHHHLRSGARLSAVEPLRTKQEQVLADVFASILDVDVVGRDDNFFDLGGDSIQSIQVVSRASRFGLLLSPRDVYEHQTVAAIAAHAAEAGSGEEPHTPVATPSSIPLTPSQAWFFEQSFEEPSRWTNDTRLWTTADEDLIRDVLDRLTQRHEALRVRFMRSGDDWIQYIPSSHQEPTLFVLDTEEFPPTGVAQTAIEDAVSRVHEGIDIVNGPLWSVGLIRTGEETLVVLVGHHLVMDGVSFLLLEDEFVRLVDAPREDWPSLLPPVLPMSAWTQRLQTYANSPELRGEYQYWHQVLATEVEPLPREKSGDLKRKSAIEFIVARLSKEDALLFRDVTRRSGLRSDALLLGALAMSFEEWRPGPFHVFVEGHCRGEVFPDMDVSRTVGWIQCYFPVVLRADASGPWATVRNVQRVLNDAPDGGLGFGVLLHLGAGERTSLTSPISKGPLRQIAFNFEGYLPSDSIDRFDATPKAPEVNHGTVKEGAQEMRGTDAPLLLVHASATNQSVTTEFTYDAQTFSYDTVRHVADSYLSALQNLVRSVE